MTFDKLDKASLGFVLMFPEVEGAERSWDSITSERLQG